MMKYVVPLIFLVVTAGFSFWLGEFISKRRHARRRNAVAQSSGKKFPLSAFSVLDHPAMTTNKEEASPLGEAEVYMTYGKKREAEKLLDNALRSGKVSAEECEAFWAKHESSK